MNRSLIILLLATLQSACSHQTVMPHQADTLLSFSEISSEISVTHEALEPAAVKVAGAHSQTESLTQSLNDNPTMAFTAGE